MAGWEAFPEAGQATADPWAAFPAADTTPASNGQPARVTVRPQGIENAIAPITDYFPTVGENARSGFDTVGAGLEQTGAGGVGLVNPDADRSPRGPIPISARLKAVGDILGGLGKTALGSAEVVTAPINAGLHTVVGTPFKENFGIPPPLSELAASMVLPIPKRIPFVGRAAPRAAAELPTTEALLQSYEPGYAAIRENPAPAVATGLKADLTAAVREGGARPSNSPKTFAALDELGDITSASKVGDIEGVRKVLLRAADDPSERKAAQVAIAKLDEVVGPAIPEIAAIRGDYAAGKRSEQFGEAIDRADRAKAPFSEAIKSEIRGILNNPNKRRGFSRAALLEMDAIAKGTYTGNAAEWLAGMTGGKGGFTGAVTGIVSHGVSPFIGAGLSKIGSMITEAQVAKLDQLLRSEAPVARKIGAPLQYWSNASQAFEASPTARNVAKLTIASRNLSNNLADVGIQIAPNRLIGINRPVAAGDQQEQP